MRVLLMRHAATAGNERRCYVGRRTDEPLSERGIEQCRCAVVPTEVHKVYASPLLRARQTATLCFPDAQVVCVKGLEEFDFGDFEGRTADEMEHDIAYRSWVETGCTGRCPGGESLQEFVERSKAALNDVLLGAHAHGEEQVVLVLHGGTIMAALDGFFHMHVCNCEGYTAAVRFVDGTAVFERVRRWPVVG